MVSTGVRSAGATGSPAGDPRAGGPSSPPAKRLRQPSWFDLRLVLGVVLILGSVLLGVRVVTAADNSSQVWAVTHAVAAGTTLSDDDLASHRVRLFDDADRYVGAGASPSGRTVSRDLGAGELLPRAALTKGVSGRLLVLPVDAMHLPAGLRRGQRIDVFASTGTGSSSADRPSARVLSAVTVQDVTRPSAGLGGNGAALGVEVRVASEQVTSVVHAIRNDQLDVALVTGDVAAARSSRPSPTPSSDAASPTPRATASPSPTPRSGGAPSPSASSSGGARSSSGGSGSPVPTAGHSS